jgi:uncharacterized flavoprotein (TIGR03862 family)
MLCIGARPEDLGKLCTHLRRSTTLRTETNKPSRKAIVIGAGPAGLMAAEVLAEAGVSVDVYDAMPSVGRKFLLAGKGGLNLTHSESLEPFLKRFGSRAQPIKAWLDMFDATALRAWAHGLGVETFIGSSGRVFPAEMKAAPLLRAWLARLRSSGVRFHTRHRLIGRSGATWCFATPDGEIDVSSHAVVLALGGASWARLGSDGTWVPWMLEAGVPVAPLRPANCGFDTPWTALFREKFAGSPVKSISAWHDGEQPRRGEFVVSAEGVEGGLVYALSAALRDDIESHGSAALHIDLLPDWSENRVLQAVEYPRGARSLSSHLQSRLGLKGVKMGLLRECLSAEVFGQPVQLARAIKHLTIELARPRPINEAISSAGGVDFAGLGADLSIVGLPGVFCAGEMIDWEAPTGGYLLTACFASGRVAGHGASAWLTAE